MRTIIVVEGIRDKQIIESFFIGEIVMTNGSDIPRGIREYLVQLDANPENQIVIMTDPDGPGLKIRNTLNVLLPNAKNVHIEKSKATRKNKVGIAETRLEDLKIALRNVSPNLHHNVSKNIATPLLRDLNLTGSNESKALRDKLSLRLEIPLSNSKTLVRILNSLGITEGQLRELVKEVKNGI